MGIRARDGLAEIKIIEKKGKREREREAALFCRLLQNRMKKTDRMGSTLGLFVLKINYFDFRLNGKWILVLPREY